MAVAAGRAVVDRASRQWLSDRKNSSDRAKPLTDLIGLNFRDAISRRRFERQLEDIADSVAERLQEMSRIEYQSLDEGDKAIAIEAATRTVSEADLSDAALFGVDLEGVALARSILTETGKRIAELGLSESGESFFRLVVEECCECLVKIVQNLPQYAPRASTESLNRLTAISGNMAVILGRIPVRRLDAPQGSEFDAEFKNRYLRLLSETLDQVEVFGVPVSNYTPRATLSIAYMSLTVMGEWYSQSDPEDLRRAHHGPDEIFSAGRSIRVEGLLAKGPRNLIRGEAGSGKSTLLHWVAISAARSAFRNDLAAWNGVVPFLIKLRSYPEGDLPAPEDFVKAATPSIAAVMPSGWVHRQLSANDAILLVDGVDELPGGRRPKVRAWLRGLIATYPGLRVIVTSRPSAAASSWLSNEGFRSAQLERMTPTDVKEFVSHWHSAVLDSGIFPCDSEEIPLYERSLAQRLATQPHLLALATTPLLAAMLCALNLDRRTQLPRDRMGLYSAALELLLERRDAERQIPSYLEIPLERRQKVLILQDLAWRLSMTNRSEMPKAAVLKRVQEKAQTMPRLGVSADALLDHLVHRSGIIREPTLGRIDFIHRTFQEYLTAKQAAEDGDVEPLVAKAHLDQWRDTIIMAAGHANSPLRSELISGLLERIESEPRHRRTLRLLVSACFETMPDIPRELSEQIDHCFRALIPPRNPSEAMSLPRAGDAVLRFFPEELTQLSESVAANTVNAAYVINGPEALRLIEAYAEDEREAVQAQLVAGWDYFDSVEYAESVLSRVPFVGGNLKLANPSHVPLIQALPHVTALELDGRIDDVSLLESVRGLTTRLHIGLQSSEHSELVHHARVQDLILLSDAVSDILWVEGMSSLKLLRIWCEGVTDLSALDSLSLRLLGLGHLEQVHDFSPVWRQKDLTWLILRKCENLYNVSGVVDLRKLRTLVLESPGAVEGLSNVLSSCKIDWLGIQDCGVGVSLADCSSETITGLDLSRSRIVESQEEPVLPNLTDLHLDGWDGVALPDLRPLRSLRSLSLDGCRKLQDISSLRDLPSLREVSLMGVHPSLDIDVLTRRGIGITGWSGQGRRLRVAGEEYESG
ncbi:NACHT domain-containing protein [Streptomyces sp.]|uniref:NACHT domain-containing protein n=1 Tax=Streptomyces sp. TaxID=1931 RepID=UPI002D776054|nr:NACHT domain-containing protein [Streptomyces sp.]